MSCLHPILVKNYRNYRKGRDEYISVPCGKCAKCLARLQSQWSFRQEMEFLDPRNKFCCFITLTYAPAFCPNELKKEHFPAFIDRLRINCERKYGHSFTIRYFCCGEYGDRFGRPHLHANLFSNFRFDEEDVHKAWNMGIIDLKPINSARCGYVAKYSLKQLKGAYGELQPPFHLCSLGLGKYFIEKFGDYVYNHRLTAWYNLSGHIVQLPRYYIDKIYPRGSVGRSSIKVTARINHRLSEGLFSLRSNDKESFYRDLYRMNDQYDRIMNRKNSFDFISRNYV